MKASLPPELKRFVEQKVEDGQYANESEVVSDAVRRLKESDDSSRLNAGSLFAKTSTYPFLSALDISGSDIEAIAFLIMMQAAKSAREDLKAIMDGVKSINAAKQKVRELIRKRAAEIISRDGPKLGERQLVLLLWYLARA